MTFDVAFLPPNFQTNEISKSKQDLVEKEDELMFWYRQFEDAKEEERFMSSTKTRKSLHNDLVGGKET